MSAKIVFYHLINGKINPADVLSNNWAHQGAWPTLKPLLFWKGDTAECLDNNVLEFEEHSWNLFVSCCSFTCWELRVLHMKIFSHSYGFLTHVCYSFI